MTSLSLTSSSARYAEEWAERTLTANSALDMPRLGLSVAERDRVCPGAPDKYDVTVADVIVRTLRGGMCRASFDGEYRAGYASPRSVDGRNGSGASRST